ncbi:MAG: hypothetical protein PHQ91_04635 [Thermoanaerobaculaceae bacterium]|nr:hypothetical protein [Thermoanaerobaculaceae bacterium]
MTRREIDGVKRRFDVVAEAITSQVRAVAEGRTTLGDEVRGLVVRVGRLEERFDRFAGELKAMLRISLADPDHRARALGSTVNGLADRAERIESGHA